ncbi:hypothetical protein L6452_19212 [Arctium lappa]|uniref:Uncharacterized protein n=1 Tax=Arctium lappa TaxID=4217 RepID=A0ACB9BCE4_ARCLA|nr:hypothetical protein L6452_19212 [Arctium lappa]
MPELCSTKLALHDVGWRIDVDEKSMVLEKSISTTDFNNRFHRIDGTFGQLSTWRCEDDDCCKWRGVTCNNQTTHVTELHLSSFIDQRGLGGENRWYLRIDVGWRIDVDERESNFDR